MKVRNVRGRLARLIAFSAALTLVASCGAFAAPAPTRDPLAGYYLARGGGGALDAVLPLTKAFSQRHPSVSWQGLDDIGSDAGVRLVRSGDIDLAFISRDLRPAELGTVSTIPIGASGTAMAVSSLNPVQALTKAQLAKIYTGEITNWRDVGGKDEFIRVLVREPGAATRSAFEGYCFDGKPPKAYARESVEVGSYDEMVHAIGGIPGAIGMMSITSQAMAEPAIRLVTIDGVPPTRDALTSGAYPMGRPLYLVYNSDPSRVKPAIKAFLDFVQSADGQAVLHNI